ncbi:hypothetical protein BCD48_29845 [Pseudofrankia sp. BMG5.36]|nr:hypothetical protein BCD48_29845 [Pseudofrankia sp. BMG5.36]
MSGAMKRHAGVRGRAKARRRDVGGLVVMCLALGTVILVLSGLVGALDMLAVGAILGAWALCVAARMVLGRYGEDWAFPAGWDVADLWPRVRAGMRRRGPTSSARSGAGGRRPWDGARRYLEARRGRGAAARRRLPSPTSPPAAMGPGAVRADASRPGASRSGASRSGAAGSEATRSEATRSEATRSEATVGAASGWPPGPGPTKARGHGHETGRGSGE